MNLISSKKLRNFRPEIEYFLKTSGISVSYKKNIHIVGITISRNSVKINTREISSNYVLRKNGFCLDLIDQKVNCKL